MTDEQLGRAIRGIAMTIMTIKILAVLAYAARTLLRPEPGRERPEER